MSRLTNEQEFLKRLKNGEPQAFKELYENYYKMVATYISRNNGNAADAQDIFQDALFVLVKKLREPDFTLTATLGTFIQAIVRNLWLYKLRGQKSMIPIDDRSLSIAIDEDMILEQELYEEKHYLIKKVFQELKEDCRQLLKAYYYDKHSLKEIATQMGYTSSFVKVKKHRCMNGFRKILGQNSDYKRFKKDSNE